MQLQYILYGLAVLVAVIGSVTDIRTRKIPNKLTFPAAIVGIIATAIIAGMQSVDSPLISAAAGAGTAVFAWLLAVAIMSLTKLFLSQFGHGDTKLMAAVATFVGPGLIPLVYLYYCLTFGLFACTRMMAAIPWNQLGAAYMSQTKEVMNLERFDKVKKEAVPVAPFIALGTILAILLQGPTLRFMGFLK